MSGPTVAGASHGEPEYIALQHPPTTSLAPLSRRELVHLPTPEGAKQVVIDAAKEGLQVSGIVVSILEAKHFDVHVGFVKGVNVDGSIKPKDKVAVFYPRDARYMAAQ